VARAAGAGATPNRRRNSRFVNPDRPAGETHFFGESAGLATGESGAATSGKNFASARIPHEQHVPSHVGIGPVRVGFFLTTKFTKGTKSGRRQKILRCFSWRPRGSILVRVGTHSRIRPVPRGGANSLPGAGDLFSL
jgi:hypothetical protein